MAEKWQLEGTLFDACNCLTLCPCNFFQNPTGSDCRAVAVWHIEKGNLGATKLDGLTTAGLIFANGNPLHGMEKAAWIIDERATPAQRDALSKIFGGESGGMFALFSKLVKNNLGITYAKFEYANDEKSWSAKAGDFLNVNGGFVKAPPDAPVESKPKRAQTYDFLFSPTMEKVVGITDHYRANLAGLNYDISGRYSSSGRFRYEGP